MENRLRGILESHAKWLKGDPTGKRANLTGANLWGADLTNANLTGAYLTDAILMRADFWAADLTGANLTGANLRGANLRGANLRGANLTGANLAEVDFKYANLRGANLTDAMLPDFQIPQGVDLVVWKKTRTGVVKIKIPSNARRTASLVGSKCRAEFAVVLETPRGEPAPSMHDPSTVYRVRETIYPDSYDPDIRVECTNGIHFFLTREEAKAYQL